MIRFSLRQLSYFVAAAEDGSTLRASETLHVSQPAVSMAINQLEQTFGQRLFVRRHAQGIELTPFGRRKLVDARHLLAHAAALGAPEGEQGLEGELEIGVLSTLAAWFVPAMTKAFADAHPGVRIKIKEDYLDALYRDLDTGVIEMALVYDYNLAEQVEQVELASFSPYVLLPANHPLGEAETVSLRDAAAEPYVLIDLPYSRDYFLSLFRAVGARPTRIIRAGSLEMVRGMVAHGHGVSTLVTRPVGDMSYDGKPLVCRPIREVVPRQRAVMAFSPYSPLTKLAETFLGESRKYFADRQPWAAPGAG